MLVSVPDGAECETLFCALSSRLDHPLTGALHDEHQHYVYRCTHRCNPQKRLHLQMGWRQWPPRSLGTVQQGRTPRTPVCAMRATPGGNVMEPAVAASWMSDCTLPSGST